MGSHSTAVEMRESMIFQSKIERALNKLHEDSDAARGEKALGSGNSLEPGMPELEKGDFLAMFLAAMITIVPAAILVLGGIALLSYFLLMH